MQQRQMEYFRSGSFSSSKGHEVSSAGLWSASRISSEVWVVNPSTYFVKGFYSPLDFLRDLLRLLVCDLDQLRRSATVRRKQNAGDYGEHRERMSQDCFPPHRIPSGRDEFDRRSGTVIRAVFSVDL